MEIIRLTSTQTEVNIKLANGVEVSIASNPGSIHVHFSGIGDSNITVRDWVANQLNINYKPAQ